MELLSQLQGEQHISGELGSRLSQQEQELKEIREQVSVVILWLCHGYGVVTCTDTCIHVCVVIWLKQEYNEQKFIKQRILHLVHIQG